MKYSIDDSDQIYLHEKGLVFGLFHDLRNDPGTIIVFNKCELGLKSAWRTGGWRDLLVNERGL